MDDQFMQKKLGGGEKAPLFTKNADFSSKKHPFYYQYTDIRWTETRILT